MTALPKSDRGRSSRGKSPKFDSNSRVVQNVKTSSGDEITKGSLGRGQGRCLGEKSNIGKFELGQIFKSRLERSETRYRLDIH